MGEILGIGVTHFPGLMLPDPYMSSFLSRTLKSDRVPAEMKEPVRWPEPLRQELAANENGGAAACGRKASVADRQLRFSPRVYQLIVSLPSRIS